jgi:hypothetical protein
MKFVKKALIAASLGTIVAVMGASVASATPIIHLESECDRGRYAFFLGFSV